MVKTYAGKREHTIFITVDGKQRSVTFEGYSRHNGYYKTGCIKEQLQASAF